MNIKLKFFEPLNKFNLKWLVIPSLLILFLSISYNVFTNNGKTKIYNLSNLVSHLEVQNVKINGAAHTKGSEVIEIIGLSSNESMWSLDISEVVNRINELPWVKKSDIKKIYPSTLEINIYEHNPIAIWFFDGKKYLVDGESNIIEKLNPADFNNLKVVAGHNALTEIPDIINTLQQFPYFHKKVKSILRVGDRRWTVRLYNGITIHLPETKIAEAITDLERLDNEKLLLSRYVDVIDMRLKDRIDILPSKIGDRSSINTI